MHYESVFAAERAAALGKSLFRVDVVLFSLEAQDDGTDRCIDGEYYEKDGDGHPFECLFDDYHEAVAYVDGFNSDMALMALADNTNYGKFDHVAIEVNELDEGLNPMRVVACREWLYGTQLNRWHGDECVGRRGKRWRSSTSTL